MSKSIYYFGTDTKSAGHYFWNIGENYMGGSTLSFPDGSERGISDWKKHPFDAENLPLSKIKGDVEFHFINGYSICAICGSPKDTRPGCKSVFFVKGKISNQELKEHIFSLIPAKEIIDKMPFEVKWPALPLPHSPHPENKEAEQGRFIKPTDEKLIDIAIIFNDGIMDAKKLADMVSMCSFVVDRLYENGDVNIPSSKEKS